ncbi:MULTISPECIES: YbdK family carboxylate-amine ligase [unclassified Herbaspirillum]|uniref:YbdK family carboxylate-amine ligase n=1 Tax=unclassified Herbaspirillum TaxID=2624150 RepID=UPI00115241A3|nr:MULTISPECIES: YbdK family carboxylate-amine ligase [unclassified Herbaspirillum]MBB5390506.1 carboxylate-amine ligase [Herbaspirillum sp. SJZ102]TQK09001.1 carboxylate-amine ligase [Herbaspirillum sp. SJZ130]TQK14312.1 carboxylate-amine ligase [Herbaspirillum sp. SJZ106]
MNTETLTRNEPGLDAGAQAGHAGRPQGSAGILPFSSSTPFTMGIELELQLVNRRNYNLASDAVDLLNWIAPRELQKQIKLEMTQGMIELNSDIHTRVDELIEELKGLRAALNNGARYLNIDVSGGGAHPFQHWNEQRITPSERFHHLHEKYGYLAKTFTVFGQHIHIGVPDGDDALYLTHAFSRFVPHFIALSAASPFYQGADTRFDSSRSNVVRAFPLSGTAPVHTKWAEFETYYDELMQMGIIASMKDFYWDIRPKPEYGTVEIRVCDTPLTIEHAAHLGAYAQLLARWVLTERPFTITDDFYLLYQYNRFEASRFGLNGMLALHSATPSASRKLPIFEHLLQQLQLLEPYVQNEAEHQTLQRLRRMAHDRLSDAGWLRQMFTQRGSLNDMMRLSSELWMGESPPPYFQ